MLMLRVLLQGVDGIGAMLMYLTMLMRRGSRMHMRGGSRPELMHEARGSVANRERHTRREHAKQIEQGDEPPCLGAHRPRQANEHDGNLGLPIDFAKVAVASLSSVILGVRSTSFDVQLHIRESISLLDMWPNGFRACAKRRIPE
jgi:hypothetical protein